MNQIRFIIFISIALFFGSFSSFAEDEDRNLRAAQWDSYALPTGEFVRFIDQKQGFSLWHPADWKGTNTDPTSLYFGVKPGERTVLVITEKLPEGYGVANYATAILQNLRKEPIKVESLVVRPVLVGGVEGREISYEIEGNDGAVRQTYWVTQVGPLGFNFVLTATPEEQEKLEPYFKRLMMSVRFNTAGHWDEDFEALRTKLANGTKSDKDAEAASLSEVIRTAKEPIEAVTKRITAIASKAPEVALEMLTDYDPNVRAAAITALGKASDARFNDVLVWALTDKDTFCSNSAAQALAERGTAGLASIKSQLPKLVETGSPLLRVAALMSDEKARELAEDLLKSDDAKQQLVGLRLAVVLPLKGLRLPYAKLFATDNVQTIGHAMEAIRLRRPTEDVSELLKMIGTDAELWAVHALGELATPAIEVQLDERKKSLSARYDKLLTSKGVVTVRASSSSSLPPPPPPPPAPAGSGAKKKTGKSTIKGVPGGIPGGVPVSVPGYSNNSSPASTPPAMFKTESEITKLWSSITELEDAITKIRLRDRWATAKDEAVRQAILDEAGKNDRLKQWAAATLKNQGSASVANPDLTKLKSVPTTGETLFPANATLYLTAPNFEQTLNQLDAAFSGIQMGTVRDQMTFALMLNSIKAQLAKTMNLNVTGSASQTLGIDLKSPISMASWPDENSRDALGIIGHSAMVIRVTDRARFERTLTSYQNDFGSPEYFVPVVSAGTRVASITPAFMPVLFYALSAFGDIASTMMGTSKERPTGASFMLGSSVYLRHEKIGELPVTIIEKLGYVGIDATAPERIYLTYIGDTAVLAPSREALLEVLKTDKPTIASSKSYDRIKAETGEIVFFSQLDSLLKKLFEEIAKDSKDDNDPLDAVLIDAFTKTIGAETGAVRLSQSDWDSMFHLALGENDWAKTMRPFKAADLAAPRDLLPKHTLLYAGMMIEPEKFLEYSKKWDAEIAKAKKTAGKEEKKNEAKESSKYSQIISGLQTLLVPHLQGEVSLALVNVSSLLSNKSKLPAVVAALKLKSDTLAKIARSGLVSLALKRVPDVSVLNSPVFRLGEESDDFLVTITDQYFIVGDSLETLKLLESKEKFAMARDFSNPAKLAPERLMLFSTLSIDAAFADFRALTSKGVGKENESNEFLDQMSAWAHAFHSYRFLMSLADEKTLQGQLGISFDRDGRFNVGAMNRKEFDLENALIAPKGLNILEPTRVESLKLKVSAQQPGVIARVREDVSKFTWQTIEPNATDSALIFMSKQRRIPDNQTIKLPVTGTELAPYLKATARINSDSPEIIKLAKEIAGKERDGHRVAEKIGQWTYDNLKWKRVSTTTVETLASREADCLEHAELYTALARALGLPARVVSGAAYSGGSFGAHAWVEIYLGKWVEVDPTWGLKDYVDATHLRFEGDGFISYAQLNQVNFEVLESRTIVADYQRDPVRLVKEFTAQDAEDARALVFDLELTAEQALGIGALAKLEEKQRAKVINAFDRAVAKVSGDWMLLGSTRPTILASEIKNNRATFLTLFGYRLARVSLASRNGIWYITEIEDADDGELSFGEAVQGVFDSAASVAPIRASSNPERALKQLETLMAVKGESAPLLLLKSNLLRTRQSRERLEKLVQKNSTEAKEQKPEKTEPQPKQPDEAQLLLEKITARWPDYAPAQYALANSYDDDTPEKAIIAYQRYAKLMPLDPRPWQQLAALYDKQERLNEAEAAHRETIARDRENIERRAELVAFYLRHAQAEKAKTGFAEMLKSTMDANAAFEALDTLVMHDYEDEVSPEMAQRFEELLLSFPKELAVSEDGWRGLSEAQRLQEKYDAAIKSLQKVIAINPEAGDQVTVAAIYRETKRFAQALAAADLAIKQDRESARAYFERACALAQLARKREALVALKKAIELDEEYAYGLEEEPDLKPLTTTPEFKALLPKDESTTEADAKPEQSKAAKP